ncbi:methyltransferase domain-containing protein [Streptomyces griseoluteus]|uniref:methyltransferase domain-containing protein n=1 Tax=Streptomyces griseoluteus TaxID=29306 RepID=UPI0036FBD123
MDRTEPDDHGLGRSRGGLSTKVRLVSDSHARPLALHVTAGQAGDATAFEAVMAGSGQRYLELGPGPGVSLALAATVTGPRLAVGVERDGRMVAFAQHNLDRLGLGATVVEGDALDGHPAGGVFDRIHSGIRVPCVPRCARFPRIRRR